MKAESLRRLMLDRAVGALSPEAAELFDEHVADREDLRHEAANWTTVADLATRALSAEPGDGLPAFPRDRVVGALERPARVNASAGFWRMAAAIMLAFGIGWLGGRLPAATEEGGPRPGPAVRIVSAAMDESAVEFWRLRRGEAPAVPVDARSVELRWVSPLKRPTVIVKGA